MGLKEAPTGGPNTRTPLERVPSTMVKILLSHRRKARITHPDGDLLPLADKSPFKQSGGFIHGLCSLISPSEVCTQRPVAAVNNDGRQRLFARSNRYVPSFLDPMVICTADGKYPLLKPSELLVEGLDGQPAISFNGEERQDASIETFHLGQHSSGCGFCKNHIPLGTMPPIRFHGKATLQIAHRLCPG